MIPDKYQIPNLLSIKTKNLTWTTRILKVLDNFPYFFITFLAALLPCYHTFICTGWASTGVPVHLLFVVVIVCVRRSVSRSLPGWLMIDWWLTIDWLMMDDGWLMIDDGWWIMDDWWWIMDDGWWMMEWRNVVLALFIGFSTFKRF